MDQPAAEREASGDGGRDTCTVPSGEKEIGRDSGRVGEWVVRKGGGKHNLPIRTEPLILLLASSSTEAREGAVLRCASKAVPPATCSGISLSDT